MNLADVQLFDEAGVTHTHTHTHQHLHTLCLPALGINPLLPAVWDHIPCFCAHAAQRGQFRLVSVETVQLKIKETNRQVKNGERRTDAGGSKPCLFQPLLVQVDCNEQLVGEGVGAQNDEG